MPAYGRGSGPDRNRGTAGPGPSRRPGGSAAPAASRVPEPTRREGGIPDGLLLGVVGFLLGVTLLTWTGTGLAGLLSHGHWPRSLHFTRTPLAMRALITQPKDLAGAWPQVPAGDLPGSGLFWGILVSEALILVVVGVFALSTMARWRAVRDNRRRLTHELLGQDAEFIAPQPAAAAPVVTPVPRHADVGDVPAAPTVLLAQPAPEAPGASPPASATPEPIGRLTGSWVLFAGVNGRTDKGAAAVLPAVLDAEGAVVVTCADDRTLLRTVGSRVKSGPVYVFDPEHRVDVPGRLRWAPHTGCEDPVTAAARARALLAPLRTHDVTANDAAVTLMRCWLHAAAVDGQSFRQLSKWAAGSGSAEALRILRTSRDAMSGWSGELESTLHAHPERRDTALAVVQRALSGLNSVHMRDACSPGRSDTFDLESFVNDRGTLYVVGTPREDPRAEPGAMPLLTALVSSVVEHGRRMAAGSSPGRLDPPMTCVLDDIATIAPLPELPALMGEGPALGIPVLAVLRSEEQARHRWPAKDAATIWQTADNRVEL